MEKRAVKVIDQPISYGLTHPIIPVGAGKILVVGTVSSGWSAQDGIPPHSLVAIDVHYDGDDPTFTFASPGEWPEIPAKIIEQYNQPFRRASRLAIRRAVDTSPFAVFDAHWFADAWMKVVRAGRDAPEDNVIVAGYGGIVRNPDAEIQCGARETDAAMMAPIDCYRARQERRFDHADLNRRAIVRRGYEPMIGREQIVFVRKHRGLGE